MGNNATITMALTLTTSDVARCHKASRDRLCHTGHNSYASTSTKAKEVAKHMTKYNLLSMAVVDRNKKLQGIVTVDDILRYLVPNA